MTKSELCDSETLMSYLFQADGVIVADYVNKIEARARELKIFTPVRRLVTAIINDGKQAQKEERANQFMFSDESKKIPSFIEVTQRGEKVNPALLAEYIRQNNVLLNVCGQRENRIFIYLCGVYRELTDASLQGLIKQPIIEYDRRLLNMNDVKKAADDLRTDSSTITDDDLNAREDLINFKNGLFSLTDNKLLPHSADVFSTVQLPFDYDATATDCRKTVEYLFSLSGEDLETVELLYQVAGVCISNVFGYRLKSAPILYGAGDSGKSQFVLLLQHLLGAENCASGSLSDLEQRFGTNALYMKRLYSDADMGFTTVDQLCIFKSLTGGDSIRIEYKGRDCFSTVYRGMLIFCTNELPRFGGDKGSWVYDRIIPIPCGNSIPREKQDKQLQNKLQAEAQAFVCSMLIPAVQRVIANNYQFTLPQKCRSARAAYEVENSPVREFFNRYCYLDGYTKAADFIMAFNSWYCFEHGGRKSGMSAKLINKELIQHLKVTPDKLKTRRSDGEHYRFGLNVDGQAFISDR